MKASVHWDHVRLNGHRHRHSKEKLIDNFFALRSLGVFRSPCNKKKKFIEKSTVQCISYVKKTVFFSF